MGRYIDPVTQYNDDAGNPLVNGKLYVFKTGTNDLLDVFFDVNQSTPAPNPVILTAAGRVPNLFFDGSAKVILTKSDDTQLWERDPVGGEFSEGVFSDWNSLTIYNENDIVTGSDGNFYIAINDGVQGQDPLTSPSDWTQIKFNRVWNANETYDVNDIVQASDGKIYIGLTADNTNNNPISDSGNWGPPVSFTIAPVITATSALYAYFNLG
tara:strand:+ start:5339 stop:5971 length:633 start_codon:yes stop_codon:yes gene_type:complete